MPDFAYTARNFEGQKVTGTLFAQSEREAVANLSTQQLFPLEVTQQKTASQKSAFTRRVSGQTMAVTYSQLASLLRSGVPLLRSLGVLRDQSSHVVLKEVLDDVYRRVEEGTTGLGDRRCAFVLEPVDDLLELDVVLRHGVTELDHAAQAVAIADQRRPA